MRIVYRREALADLDRHFSYIGQDRPTAAQRVVERIRHTIERLGTFPYSGRQGSVEGTFELVVPGLPYIAIYRVTDRVEIVAVFHAAVDRNDDERS